MSKSKPIDRRPYLWQCGEINGWRLTVRTYYNALKKRIHTQAYTLSFLTIFALCNTLLFCLLCIPYLHIILSSETLFNWPTLSLLSAHERILLPFGLITSYIGQCALLAYLPTLLILLPLTLLAVSHRIIVALACILSTVSVILLLTDIIVFSTYHFHVNPHLVPLLAPSDLSNTEWAWVLIVSTLTFFLESTLIYVTQRFMMTRKQWRQVSDSFAYSWPIVLIASYMAYITSANGWSMLTQQTPVIPLYNQTLALLLRYSPWNVNISKASETLFSQPALPTSKLFYPKHPLVFSPNQFAKSEYNIVMIVIDAWRFDAFNERLTPNLYAFSNMSWYFKNHVSGGNCTEAGLTSLLYGLPHLYWRSLKTEKRGALLVDSLQKKGYQTKILFSSFMMPRFDITAFASVPHLRTQSAPGKTIPDKDRTITKEWVDFVQHRDKTKPFFTFSLYDAAHGYCSKQNIEPLYADAKEECDRLLITDKSVKTIHHRYLNAVHFLDQEIGIILQELRTLKLLDNTIVMITGDHGEEFYDTELKYLGHSSNYSIFQTHTPLIIHWPNTAAHTFTHETSHYDIVPTLMKEALRCENPLTDFSLGGKRLWDTAIKKEYVLAGSYTNSAILQGNKRAILMASGEISITDQYGKEQPKARIDQTILKHALNDFRWFYTPANEQASSLS